jgi:hypothetical protein
MNHDLDELLERANPVAPGSVDGWARSPEGRRLLAEASARTARRPQTQRRRRALVLGSLGIAAATVAVLLVAVLPSSEPPGPDISATQRPAVTSGLLVALHPFELRIVDPDTGRSSNLRLPEAVQTSVGDPASTVLARRGAIVFVAGTTDPERSEVWVLRAPYTDDAEKVGEATVVLESQVPDRVWLVTASDVRTDRTSTRTGALSFREVGMDGETTRTVDVPCCRWPVAHAPEGLVVSDAEGFEIRDLGTGETTEQFPGEGFAGSNGRWLATTNHEGCGGDGSNVVLHDRVSGEQTDVGYVCGHFGPAEFSPDGRRMSVWALGDGASATLTLVRLGRTPGEPTEAPRSRNAEYASSWGSDGRVYYTDADAEIVSFDPGSGEVRSFPVRGNAIVRDVEQLPPP